MGCEKVIRQRKTGPEDGWALRYLRVDNLGELLLDGSEVTAKARETPVQELRNGEKGEESWREQQSDVHGKDEEAVERRAIFRREQTAMTRGAERGTRQDKGKGRRDGIPVGEGRTARARSQDRPGQDRTIPRGSSRSP